MNLKPFFCFYGGKWRAAPRYPAPEGDLLIEPFAGAAGYAVRHHERQVVLYEADPVLAGVWDYLINVDPDEVRALPLDFGSVDDLLIPQEAKWLIGFWLNKGAAQPCKTPSAWMRLGTHVNSYWGATIRDRIANQVGAISHWKIHNASYEDAPDVSATWFVDPPYEKAGKHYRFRDIDYQALATWCRARRGLTIVCENSGATWLPFQDNHTAKSTPGARGKGYSREAVWIHGSEQR